MLRELTDREFAVWLAGFVDGEGCFTIRYDRRDDSFRCAFHLRLRADDRAILDEIRSRTGLGRVYTEARRPPSKPCVSWRVSSKDECQALGALLDGLLQSKKSRDLAVWIEAVREWIEREHGIGGRSGTVRKADWSRMAVLCGRLHDGRKYKLAPEGGT